MPALAACMFWFCKLPDGVPRPVPPRRDLSPLRVRQPVTGPHLGYVPRTLGLQSIQRKQDRPDRSDVLRVKLQVALRPTLPSCSGKHFKHADCRSPQCWRKSTHGISVARRTEGEKRPADEGARPAIFAHAKRRGERTRCHRFTWVARVLLFDIPFMARAAIEHDPTPRWLAPNAASYQVTFGTAGAPQNLAASCRDALARTRAKRPSRDLV